MLLKSLPILKSPQWLMSFDFDDTLFDGGTPDHVPERFFSLMRQWREEFGLIWGINTGRTIEYLWQDYSVLPHAAFAPDFMITMERHIHMRNEHGELQEIVEWNTPCAEAHEELYVNHKKIFDKLFAQLEYEHSSLHWMRQDDDPYSIIVEDPDYLDHMEKTIHPIISPHPDIGMQRAGPYLRFCLSHYNKGTALREICRQFGIEEQCVFIFGDGHNDMDAMKENPLAMCISPANGADPLHALVMERGGNISPKTRNQGVLDALHNFCFLHMRKNEK